MSKYGNRPGSLHISGTGLTGGTKVQLDGEDIANSLAGVSLRIGLADRPTAVLDVVLHDLSTDVDDPVVAVPEKTHALLVKLGWLPPAEQQGSES